MGRGDLSDAECELIGPLLPPERGRWARPAGDNRRFLNGMLHVLRVGCPWRDMHERYGKWNSVYVRFRRWAEQGVWDALLQTLVELGLTDDWQHTIDSTSVRGHVSAAGGKGGLVRTLLVDHAAALRAKNHARCDNQGLPLGFILTGGEASDYTAAEPLMEIPVAAPKALLADKGYDGDRFRESLLIRGILPIIPARSNRKVPEHPDYRRYRNRNRVERMFGKLKQQRRIATRYGKTILSFESFLNLAAPPYG
ncbi:IS5 family transposase [Erythrobacter westpacificensis]|uniref:IS5 family transposase n=1 Tax=Erythrobacter westpacificensis TaxID=1055231 RepID=A0ABP9KT03_9SPHN